VAESLAESGLRERVRPQEESRPFSRTAPQEPAARPPLRYERRGDELKVAYDSKMKFRFTPSLNLQREAASMLAQ
jgi:hypothetical protein